MHHASLAEYLWLDGARPTQTIRSKTRIVQVPDHPTAADFPAWSFDGSSTLQASGDDSDCLLEPVRIAPDPVRGRGHHLVLCEVLAPDGSSHASNQRAPLREAVAERGGGYLEDRRPGANADPYRVAAMLVETICRGDAVRRVA